MGPSSFEPEKKHTTGQWGSPYNTKFPPRRRFFSTAACVSPARRSRLSADGEDGNGRVRSAGSGACRSSCFSWHPSLEMVHAFLARVGWLCRAPFVHAAVGYLPVRPNRRLLRLRRSCEYCTVD